MSNLRLKRRTRQLDDAQPVVLAGSGDNVIHTTRGELAMSGDDKARLTHNLRAQQRATLVAQLVEKVHAQWATFLERTVAGVAPRVVLEAYVNHGDEAPAWQEWLRRLNVRVVQDGLTLRVYINGTEQGSARAAVTPTFESEVLTMLKMEQGMVDRPPQ